MKTFCIFLFAFSSLSLFGQNENSYGNELAVHEITMPPVEVEPSFPGGKSAMDKYISDNFNYPSKAMNNGVNGIVYVVFVVEKNGEISNVTLLEGVEKSLDNEALRLVKNMPNWIPGQAGGVTTAIKMRIPIKFFLLN